MLPERKKENQREKEKEKPHVSAKDSARLRRFTSAGQPEGLSSSFFMMVMERRFPHRLKDMNWKQRPRAGRMALRWESLIPHCSKYNPWRVAALSPAELGGAQDWSRTW